LHFHTCTTNTWYMEWTYLCCWLEIWIYLSDNPCLPSGIDDTRKESEEQKNSIINIKALSIWAPDKIRMKGNLMTWRRYRVLMIKFIIYYFPEINLVKPMFHTQSGKGFPSREQKKHFIFQSFFFNYSFIHMCIHCLVHFFPLPPFQSSKIHSSMSKTVLVSDSNPNMYAFYFFFLYYCIS
jgi:hypothetical protein